MFRFSRFGVALGAAVLALSGCGAKSPPDPNDPAIVGILQPEVLQRNLRWASEMVNDRVARQEIDDEEGRKLLAKYAEELVEKVDFKHMRETQAWQYAEIFRTAERWDLAEKALDMAVAHALKHNNDDRRVNDALRLAQAQAHLGKHELAIKTARSTFSAREQDKAPILLAVLYEIAPAARGHNLDAELARLVEDAIEQHTKVVVDAEDEAGRAFLAAKAHHLRNAWQMVIDLFRAAGKIDEAERARAKMDAMRNDLGRL